MRGIMRRRGRLAALAEERHEPEPEHIERRHEGSDDPEKPEHNVQLGAGDRQESFAGEGLPENLVFREETSEWRNARDGDGGHGHSAEGPWNQLAKAAHVAHILLAGE